MIVDPASSLRTAILAMNSVTALVSTRVYAERDTPPVGYEPSDGRCIVFKARGDDFDEEAAVIGISYQVKFYGETEAQAYDLYRTFYTAANFLKSGSILNMVKETGGQTLIEPETQWIFVLAFFYVQFLNS